METGIPEVTLCGSCGNTMQESVENYVYSDSGLDIIVRDCEVRRCECGRLDANFDPKEVEKELAIYLLTQENTIDAKQAGFVLNYVMTRMDGFTYFNQVGRA